MLMIELNGMQVIIKLVKTFYEAQMKKKHSASHNRAYDPDHSQEICLW